MLEKNDFLLRTKYFKVACKYFDYINFFDAREIFDILLKLNFKPIAKLPPPEFGAKIRMVAYIAEKNRHLIYIDTDKQILRVLSFDFVDIPIALDMLKCIVNKIEVYYNVSPKFYELAWELSIETEKISLETFRKISSNIIFLKDINNELDSDFSFFGIRLFSGKYPNSPNWIDIRIEPNISRNGKDYYVGVIYRDDNWDNFSKHVM